MLSSCSYTLLMINLDTKPCPHFRFFSQHNRQSLCHSCFISLAWAIENTPSPLALNQCMEMEQQKRRVKSNEDLICKIWHSFHIFFCSFTSYYQRKHYCVRRTLHGEHCCWNQSVSIWSPGQVWNLRAKYNAVVMETEISWKHVTDLQNVCLYFCAVSINGEDLHKYQRSHDEKSWDFFLLAI